jgi:hypothetical protein
MILDGQQAQAMQLIDKQLIQRHLDQSGPERYQLLMLKAEAAIQLNKASMAVSIFDQAVRAAPDGRSAAVARANALLFRASPTNKYTPKRADAEPVDLVNLESRRMAFDAFRADMAANTRPKIARATQAGTLRPALELFPAVLDLASIEFASKGSIEDTRADVAAMGEHARNMMRAEIGRSQRRINGLGDLAYSTEEGDRRGLQSNELKELQPMVEELRRIEKTARDVRRRAQELGTPDPAWEQIAADAADLADAAERIAESGAQSSRG